MLLLLSRSCLNFTIETKSLLLKSDVSKGNYQRTEMYKLGTFSAQDAWLIISNRYYVRKLTTDNQYYTLVTDGLYNVVGLDFDLKEQMYYFVDVHARKIQRMFMNGTGLETLVWHGLPGPEGIAIDWIGRYTALEVQMDIWLFCISFGELTSIKICMCFWHLIIVWQENVLVGQQKWPHVR